MNNLFKHSIFNDSFSIVLFFLLPYVRFFVRLSNVKKKKKQKNEKGKRKKTADNKIKNNALLRHHEHLHYVVYQLLLYRYTLDCRKLVITVYERGQL